MTIGEPSTASAWVTKQLAGAPSAFSAHAFNSKIHFQVIT
jgi:hypothetical protein